MLHPGSFAIAVIDFLAFGGCLLLLRRVSNLPIRSVAFLVLFVTYLWASSFLGALSGLVTPAVAGACVLALLLCGAFLFVRRGGRASRSRIP